MIKFQLNPKYEKYKSQILDIPENFNTSGEILEANRNIIKVIDIEDLHLNVKAFKIPNIINRFAYAHVRKSKAERSFQYANMLLENGIGTPSPIAYILYKNSFGITNSYYISLQIDYDYIFRDLKIQNPDDMETILREFTRFTYKLHVKDIYFIDHSPGNTLIKRTNNGYHFYLVDLNRIKFMKIDSMTGLKNFYRLNATDSMIEIIADEYAKLTNSDSAMMINSLKDWTHEHNEKVRLRKERKQK